MGRDQFIPFLTKVVAFFLLLSSPGCYADDPGKEMAELTFAMIKPDGVSGNYTSSIKKIILDSGFGITEEAMVHLDEDFVKNFYAEHSSKIFFSSLLQYMTSGPVFIMVLEKMNAIADWRALIGPTDPQIAKITHPNSIRAMCGVDFQRNCVHGSDSPQSAAREISFFLKKSPDKDYTLEMRRLKQQVSGSITKHDEL